MKGEILELKNTINTMVDQLNAFASEVTRVAREVGTEGKLGGQAQVRGRRRHLEGPDRQRQLDGRPTSPTRCAASPSVVTAVANGDLKRKLTVEAKGEIAALADTINGMIDTLATFADQVTNVAREVGIEGKLGGQARVPGAAGLWRDLTDNVNQLAANLTTQVRAIAEVATAVTKGDLTRSITVEASGEVAALKDNINEMIRNLQGHDAEEHRAGLAEDQPRPFTRMLQGQRDLATVSQPDPVRAGAAGERAARRLLRRRRRRGRRAGAELLASYAFTERKSLREPLPARRRPGRPVRAREEAHPADQRAGRLRPDRLGARRGARRSTSSCCRCCSRAKSRR